MHNGGRSFSFRHPPCLPLLLRAACNRLLFCWLRWPWALAVLPEQIVWLSVDEQLWRLNAHGKREASIDTRQSLGGAVGVLAVHPSGQLVAWVRQQTALHVLDARSGQARHRINPQWPADLRSHADEAIHLAFAPDGRFAIATGGGHAVVLFDAAGRMLARTPATLTFSPTLFGGPMAIGGRPIPTAWRSCGWTARR